MGVETRKGKLYYYKKRREGDRVVSEYVGSGEIVQMADRMAALERERRKEQRESLQAQASSLYRINSMVDSYSEMVDRVVGAHLLALGYHKHNRQWRRRRG
ncbi:MAG TPA: hypothetical protein VFQ92_13550 [Blastocatellia bacterium]|nr:hypothetical protein [Blastocatellia bacterium]